MTVKVAINGFGRIGRLVARAVLERGDTGLELVAISLLEFHPKREVRHCRDYRLAPPGSPEGGPTLAPGEPQRNGAAPASGGRPSSIARVRA